MAKYELLLPKMGESVAEATVIKWLKQPGDYIAADEAVMEIATDKVDSDVPTPVSGKLILQLYHENDVVQVGAVIAVIETEEPEAHGATPEAETIATPEATETQPLVEEQAKVEEPAASTAEDVPVEELPKTEETQATEEAIPGTELLIQEKPSGPVQYNSTRFYSPLVKNIAAQEGIEAVELDNIPGTGAEGRLTKDDLLNYLQTRQSKAEPVTDPATVTREHESTYTEVARPAETGIVTAEEQMTELEPGSRPSDETTPPAPEMPATVIPEVEKPAQQMVAEMPAPAAEEPVKAAELTASASVKAEVPPVEEAKPQPKVPEAKPAVSVSGGDEIIEMDRMRRLIADHMVYSMQTSPHVTSFVEADVTHLVQWREKVKNNFEKREGEKITFTPIFIEAVVKAIKEFPMINVSVDGTRIIKKKNINISMATALPSGNLIVPVIKKADELSLLGITKAVNDLSTRARTNKLLPDDVKDGTFTITNVGSFGNIMGTPIINQPQVAILAVGAIKKKPAVIETREGDLIGIRHLMFLSLSYDHRVVDGALGGSFLRKIADYLESWDVNRSV